MKVIGTDKEKALYAPQDTFYTALVPDFVKGHVSVDVFMCASSSYVDIASVGVLPRQTGGHVYFYPNFNSAKDGDKFYYDLVRNLTRTTGFEGLMRVRCSKGKLILLFSC